MIAHCKGSNRRGWLAATLVGALVAGGASGADAQDVPVTIRAERFQVDHTGGVLEASGSVVVTAGDVVVRADRLRLDLRVNEIGAEGNVVIEAAGQRVRGRALVYRLLTREGRLDEAETQVGGPPIHGVVSLRARRVEGTMGGATRARDVVCTTCEGPTPFVQLTAREMQLFPNDRLVGRGVRVMIAGRTVFTWPYFTIFLRRQQASRLFPVAGYSPLEGFYLKTFAPYSLSQHQYGHVRLDLMERLGVGIGVEHTYRLAHGGGVAFLYHLFNTQLGGAEGRILLSHEQRVGDVTLRLYADHVGRAARLALSTSRYVSLDADHRGPRSATVLHQHYTGVAAPGFGADAYVARFVHLHGLTSSLWAELALDVTRLTGPGGSDDDLAPRLVLSYRGSDYTLALIGEGRIDADGDTFTRDARLGVERLPELTVSLDPRPLRHGLVYQLTASAGRFREAQALGVVAASRGEVAALLTGSPVLSDRASLTLHAEARAAVYSTGAFRGTVTGQVNYVWSLDDAWHVQVWAALQDSAGASPFVFDQPFPRSTVLSGELVYRTPSLQAAVVAGYDAAGGRPLPVVARAQYAPRRDWLLAAALLHDPTVGRLARAELAFDIRPGPAWQVSYYGVYDGGSGRVFHDRIAVTRIWQECLATALTYRGTSNEVWLEAWLVAIPWARGRVGVGSQGNLLFEQPWLGGAP